MRAQGVPAAWSKAERERLHLDFCITIKSLTGNIALRLAQRTTELAPAQMQKYLKGFRSDLVRALKEAIRTFEQAGREIAKYRRGETQEAERSPSPEQRRRLDRTASAHLIALRAVERAVGNARRARAQLTGEITPEQLDDLKRRFDEAAHEIRKAIHPARNFISSVLDRELAAAAEGGRTGWDPAELAFAAASYGYAAGAWDDERLRRAGEFLAGVITERGRFPVGQPIHSKQQGYKLNVFGGEILRAFAQLLQHVESIPIEVGLVRKLLHFFEDTKGQRGGEVRGWYHEGPQPPIRPDRSVSAVAVLALDRINRMLDARINVQVLRQFSVKYPPALRKGPTLQTAFYGDYGLAQAPRGRVAAEHLARRSVAVFLERMRAHVAGVLVPEEGEPLYSMVLHGPPGTGKTTLAEALALSCGVPLVEVTPSDIVMGGEEAVERQTRALFKALSLLTRAVICFDEFEPVLWRRKPGEATPRSVFFFLTPGMLPKLKTLNKTAGFRSVAYILITNLIGELDEAAVREGRFDCKMGIYPPDLLSRTGRLLTEVGSYFDEQKNRSARKDLLKRAERVVRETAGGPMQVLGKPGWFTRPRDQELQRGTPFAYLCGEGRLGKVNPEAKLALNGEKDDAELEYRQWAWVEQWDKLGVKALEHPPKDVPKLPAREETKEPSSASARPASAPATPVSPPSGPRARPSSRRRASRAGRRPGPAPPSPRR